MTICQAGVQPEQETKPNIARWKTKVVLGMIVKMAPTNNCVNVYLVRIFVFEDYLAVRPALLKRKEVTFEIYPILPYLTLP